VEHFILLHNMILSEHVSWMNDVFVEHRTGGR
jgi:hypothetical protein